MNNTKTKNRIETLKNFDEFERSEILAIEEYCRGMYSFDTDYEYLEQAIEIFRDGTYIYYPGVYSYTELAEMFVDEGVFGDIPARIAPYIDFEAIGNDLRYDYEKLTGGMIRVD